jgi:enterobactin synthetase component D
MNIQVISSIQTKLSYTSQLLRFDMDSFQASDFEKHNIIFPARLNKAVAKRQGEYFAGRLAAKNVLQALAAPEFQVNTGDDRAPIWPEGFLGSISHSKGVAMAMATSAQTCKGLGIDLEHFMSDSQEQKLQTHILGELDKPMFEKLAAHLERPLTLVFSAKESIFKALYPSVKRFFGFEAAALIAFDSEKLHFRITQPLSDLVPEGTKVTVFYQLFEGWLLTECEFK